jgi:hypothetical protein
MSSTGAFASSAIRRGKTSVLRTSAIASSHRALAASSSGIARGLSFRCRLRLVQLLRCLSEAHDAAVLIVYSIGHRARRWYRLTVFATDFATDLR